MSEKVARVHTHGSNRAKRNHSIEHRKPVFKSVLDNPFRIQWPSIPLNVQNALLSLLLSGLPSITQYQEKRKRQRDDKSAGIRKKRKMDNQEQVSGTSTEVPTADDIFGDAHVEETSDIQCVIVGLNEVTRRLESQIRKIRTVVATTKFKTVSSQLPLRVILVCREDINPKILVEHLPHLVAAYNSAAQPEHLLKLVVLPKSAEATLATAMGLRRAAVIGLLDESPDLKALSPLLTSVPTLTASWLTPATARSRLLPAHIKQLRTFAPKDMRAEKERRKGEKALAKERAKTRRPRGK